MSSASQADKVWSKDYVARLLEYSRKLKGRETRFIQYRELQRLNIVQIQNELAYLKGKLQLEEATTQAGSRESLIEAHTTRAQHGQYF